jgi:Cobalamin-5-phosphate synthase
MKALHGFSMAWGMFTALPCPHKVWDEDARKDMLRMLPAVGLILGLLWSALFLLLDLLGTPAPLSAALLTVFPFLATGSIHLDGFMDVNDAVCSRLPLEEKRRILKDSHIGAFAVISAALMFVLFFGAMFSLTEGGNISQRPADIVTLTMIPVMSRMVSVSFVLGSRPMETSQYSGHVCGEKEKSGRVLCVMLLIAAVIFAASALFLDVTGMYLLRTAVRFFVTFAVSCAAAASGKRRLGGMNGDISGYGIVFGELAGVIALAWI